MPTDVEICNIALSFIGTGEHIASLSENSNEADACDQFYEVALKEILREYPWPFATKRAALAVVDEDPDDYDEWAYSYRYPSDCLFARRIASGVTPENYGSRIPFMLAQDSTGLLILTNEEDAYLEYTYYASTTAHFPSDFVVALAYRIAAYIAPRVSKDPGRLTPLVQMMYDKSLVKARKAGANEQKFTPNESEFIDGR